MLNWARPSDEAMRVAVKEAKRNGGKIKPVDSPRHPNCFFAGKWLFVVFVNPDSFPPQLTRAQRLDLIELGHHSGRYSPIAFVEILEEAPNPPRLGRIKSMPDYNSFYYPRFGP